MSCDCDRIQFGWLVGGWIQRNQCFGRIFAGKYPETSYSRLRMLTTGKQPGLLFLFWLCMKVASPDPTFSFSGVGVDLSGDWPDLKIAIKKLDGLICRLDAFSKSPGRVGWVSPNGEQTATTETNPLTAEEHRPGSTSSQRVEAETT
jgi:hypothetical protein